jgi:voltage-gated potassium channel Kch
MQDALLRDITLLLAASFAVLSLFHRLNLSPILGYFAVGNLAGPHGFGWLPLSEDTRFLASLLEMAEVPFVAIDRAPGRIREAQRCGHRAVFGDARRPAVLHAAGLEQARIVAVTFDNRDRALAVLERVRHTAPAVPILATTADDRDVDALRNGGASLVLPEHLGTSLAIGAEILTRLGHPAEDTARRLLTLRNRIHPGEF